MSTECYPITILPHISQLYRDYLAMAERGTDAPVIADPARPAGQLAARPGRPGALAAVIAERQQHTSIPGPGGARRSSGPACRSPRSGRRANLPGTDSRRAPPIGDGA